MAHTTCLRYQYPNFGSIQEDGDTFLNWETLADKANTRILRGALLKAEISHCCASYDGHLTPHLSTRLTLLVCGLTRKRSGHMCRPGAQDPAALEEPLLGSSLRSLLLDLKGRGRFDKEAMSGDVRSTKVGDLLARLQPRF